MNKIVLIILAFSSLLVACTPPKVDTHYTIRAEGIEKDGLKLSAVELNEALIEGELLGYTETFSEETGEIIFEYDIDAYNSDYHELRYSVNNAGRRIGENGIAEPVYLEGNNVVLMYLSTTTNISLKSSNTFEYKNNFVGRGATDFDESAAHLIYLEPPIGERELNEQNQLIVDFYLINTQLSETGNKVMLSIDSTDFLLTEWTAYALDGLPPGEHRIRMRLIDNNGDLIEGPFNDSGDRRIIILE